MVLHCLGQWSAVAWRRNAGVAEGVGAGDVVVDVPKAGVCFFYLKCSCQLVGQLFVRTVGGW